MLLLAPIPFCFVFQLLSFDNFLFCIISFMFKLSTSIAFSKFLLPFCFLVACLIFFLLFVGVLDFLSGLCFLHCGLLQTLLSLHIFLLFCLFSLVVLFLFLLTHLCNICRPVSLLCLYFLFLSLFAYAFFYLNCLF